MSDSPSSARIAEVLSDLWSLARLPEFREYLHRFHKTSTTGVPQFRCIFIGETESGSLENGPLPGLIRQWYCRDDSGFREIKCPKMDWEGESEFIATPVVLFWCDGLFVTISERLGERLLCYKTARIRFAADRVTIDEVEPLN